MAYLDCAAHSPIDPEVMAFLDSVSTNEWGNPHNLSHDAGRKAAQAIELAREQVSELFGAPSEEVVFTSGATEANNLAVLGTAKNHESEFSAVTTPAEHASVLAPLEELKGDAKVAFLPLDSKGKLVPQDLSELLTCGVNLVSILLVNNETGTIQPIEEVSAITSSAGIALHVDATQAVGRIDTTQLWNHADMISVSAHKFGGPTGVGALIGGKDQLRPILFGGTQQHGLRPGTLPTQLIAAFGLASTLRRKRFAQEVQRLEQLTVQLREDLLATGGRVLSPKDAAPGILNVAFEGIESESLLAILNDVALSTGAACSAEGIRTSHVLRAMGILDSVANSAIRISINAQTCSTEIDYGVKRIREAIESLRACKSDFSVLISP